MPRHDPNKAPMIAKKNIACEDAKPDELSAQLPLSSRLSAKRWAITNRRPRTPRMKEGSFCTCLQEHRMDMQHGHSWLGPIKSVKILHVGSTSQREHLHQAISKGREVHFPLHFSFALSTRTAQALALRFPYLPCNSNPSQVPQHRGLGCSAPLEQEERLEGFAEGRSSCLPAP